MFLVYVEPFSHMTMISLTAFTQVTNKQPSDFIDNSINHFRTKLWFLIKNQNKLSWHSIGVHCNWIYDQLIVDKL